MAITDVLKVGFVIALFLAIIIVSGEAISRLFL
jgi:hypothetical protein